MKRYLIAAALLLVSSSAFATYCPPGTDHAGQGKPYYPNNCNDPPAPPSNPGTKQGQTANGYGGTGVGIGVGGAGGQGGKGGNATGGKVSGSGNSRNANRNSNNNAATSTSGATSASGVDASGNSLNQLDLSDRSTSSVRSNVFIPGDLPGNAMNIAPGAFITTAGDTECGVLLTKIRTPIYQWDKKGKKKHEAGYDEDVIPYVDANGVQVDYQRVDTGDGGYYLRGSHVTYVLATAGGSASSQLGLQGGGGGGYGGVSYGSGAAYSQAGVRILIRPCIAARVAAKPPVVKAWKPRPVMKKKRRPVYRAPACVPQAARVCPKA